MRTRTSIIAFALGAIAALTLAISPGCSSIDPTGVAVANGLDSGFAAIRQDAELGLAARQNIETAALLGVAPISEGAADFAHETLDYHQFLIDIARDRANGTVDPGDPLPPGPTTAP